LCEHADEVEWEAVWSGWDVGGENDFPDGCKVFELGTPLATTADFEGDAPPLGHSQFVEFHQVVDFVI